MGRLTYKSNGEYLADSYIDEAMIPFIDKLGQKEDDDEMLGIDSHILFKALTNGFYTIREDLGLITDARLVLNHTYPKFEFVRDNSMYFYSLKDYGKTWALTKEELETKDIKEDAPKQCNEKGCYYCENINSPDACPLFKYLDEIRYSIKR